MKKKEIDPKKIILMVIQENMMIIKKELLDI